MPWRLHTYITVLDLVLVSVHGAGTALRDVLLHGQFAQEHFGLVHAGRLAETAVGSRELVGEGQLAERGTGLFRVELNGELIQTYKA